MHYFGTGLIIMNCENCKKEIGEIENAKILCSECYKTVEKERERQKILIRTVAELINWKRVAERRGNFSTILLCIAKDLGVYDKMVEEFKKRTMS